MGNQDNASKIWMGKPEVFASIFNCIIFKNKELKVDPKNIQLYSKNTTTYVPKIKNSDVNYEIRDISMLWKPQNTLLKLVELNIENQTKPNPVMPYRVFNYNAGSFFEQLGDYYEITSKITALKKKIDNESNEVIKNEMFMELDDLYEERNNSCYPVITVVLCFSKNPWNYPRSLHDMWGITKNGEFNNKYKGIKRIINKFLPNYKIPIIEVRKFTDSQLKSFDRNIREVFKTIKESYSHDNRSRKDFYDKVHKLNIRFPQSSCLFLSAILKDNRYNDIYMKYFYNKDVDGDEGEIPMCKILDYAEDKGKAEGIEQQTREKIMKMFEQNYTKEQILGIFDEISEEQYNKFLKEYNKNKSKK